MAGCASRDTAVEGVSNRGDGIGIAVGVANVGGAAGAGSDWIAAGVHDD